MPSLHGLPCLYNWHETVTNYWKNGTASALLPEVHAKRTNHFCTSGSSWVDRHERIFCETGLQESVAARTGVGRF